MGGCLRFGFSFDVGSGSGRGSRAGHVEDGISRECRVRQAGPEPPKEPADAARPLEDHKQPQRKVVGLRVTPAPRETTRVRLPRPMQIRVPAGLDVDPPDQSGGRHPAVGTQDDPLPLGHERIRGALLDTGKTQRLPSLGHAARLTIGEHSNSHVGLRDSQGRQHRHERQGAEREPARHDTFTISVGSRAVIPPPCRMRWHR